MRLIDLEALGIDMCNPNIFENKGYADGWNSAISILKNTQIVNAEPVRHGKWINSKAMTGITSECEPIISDTYKCSECSEDFVKTTRKYNYCPNCGAKMDESEES